MICFRDMSFCLASTSGQCVNTECDRFFGDGQRAAAEAWRGPVDFLNHWDGCADRKPCPEMGAKE